MFADDKKMLVLCVTILAACLAILGFMGKGAPDFIELIAGISIFGALKSGSYLIHEYRMRDKTGAETKVDNIVLMRRVNFAKWYLVVAFSLCVPILLTVPAIKNSTGISIPTELNNQMVLINIFFVPLFGLAVMMPLVGLLNRSVLRWGLALVFVPLGSLIVGGILFGLGRAEIKDRIHWES